MWALMKFALRKDRVKLSIWLIILGLVPAGIAASFADIYPDRASRVPFAQDIQANAGLLATTGPAQDLLTIGGLTTWRAMGTTCTFTAIMSFLLVLRHTRADEESGRLELLRSAPINASAPLRAALLTAVVANLVLAGLIALGLIVVGLPPGGSAGFGLAVGLTGLVFAGLGAVAAQLTEVTRAATAIASAVLATAYLLRAIGDSTETAWISWLSPLGWAQRMRPFGGDQVELWTPLLPVGATVALSVVAFRLVARRDFGSGIVAARPGPAQGRLNSSFALAWRLQRGPLLGWVVGFAVLGTTVGFLADSVQGLVEDSAQLADVLEALGGGDSVVDSYLGTVFAICGVLAGAYAVSALLRLSAEESEGRAEMLLATPVSRLNWALGHLAVVIAGSALLMLVGGLFTGVTFGLVSGDLAGQVPGAVLAALSQVFAVWVLAGLTVLIFGFRPRAGLLAWLAVGLTAVVELLGPALKLPQAVLDISPFTHLPELPGAGLTVVPWLWLFALTAVLTAAGLIALNRRDLH
ncbi:ABC transporter permease [Kineosporia babensis]|uniref:ABC-2 type transport system permease protein n=1 Tax=Kineosporia babensis TaxID=499548 RepID=A0A9X1NIY2_9ACTN|nr:hypothetical protein [Kineosporia babensis]MCD5314669.1 hypothetical protein [Kineosporia babensis]